MTVPIVICLCGSHTVAIMSLKTHIIHWRKLENTHREMFSRTNHMEEYSTKNHLASTKANHISKCTLFVPFVNIKAAVKKYPVIISVISVNLKLPKY